MDPFQPPVNTVPFPEAPKTPPQTNSETQNTNTANLAAIGSGAHNKGMDFYNAAVARNQQLIDEGQEDLLRRQATADRYHSTVQNSQVVTSASLNVSNPNAAFTKSFLDMEYGVKQEPNALELNGIEGIQNQAISDPHTATAINLQVQKDAGEQHDSIRDYAYKTAVFGKAVDALHQEYKNLDPLDRGLSTFDNFVGSLFSIVDLPKLAAATEIAKTQGTQNDLEAIYNPAGFIKKNLDLLWSPNISRQQFDALLPKVLEAIKGQTFNVTKSNLESFAGLHGFNNQDVWGQNFQTFSILAPETLILARKSTRLAEMLGNRSLASETSASRILEDSGLATKAPGAVEADEAIATAMPSHTVPDVGGLARPWIGEAAATNYSVDAQKLIARLQEITSDTRLSPAQKQAARANAVEVLQTRYGRLNILDTRLVTPDELRAAPHNVSEEQFNEIYNRAAEKYPEATHEAILSNIAEELRQRSVEFEKQDLATLRPSAKDKELLKDLVPAKSAEDTSASDLYTPPKETLGTEITSNRYLVRENPETRIETLHIYIGPKSGNSGFLTQFAAKVARTNLGLHGAEIVPTMDGKFALQIRHNVAENGVYEPALTDKDFRETNVVSRWVRSADNITFDDFAGSRHFAYEQRNRIQQEVLNPIKKNLKALSAQEKDRVLTMHRLSEDAQDWFDTREKFVNQFEEAFPGKTPSEKEFRAYLDARTLSDLEHHIRNVEQYINAARRGEETIQVSNTETGFNSMRRNARIVTQPEWNTRIYDVEANHHYAPGEDSGLLAEKYGDGNHYVVEFTGDLPSFGQEPIKTVLVPIRDTEIHALEPDQIGYVRGGHRSYEAEFFAKQYNEGQYRNGDVWVGNPHTHAAFTSFSEGTQHVASLNSGLAAYRSFEKGAISADELTAILEATPFETTDRLEQMLQEGRLNKDHDFEVCHDKQLPTQYENLSGKQFIGDSDVPGKTQYLNSTGRMYYSPKNVVKLDGPQDMKAAVVNQFKVLNRAINNAVQMRSFGNYFRRSVEEWMRLAGDDLVDIPGSSPMDRFMNAKFKPEVYARDPKRVGFLESNRAVIKDTMNLKSELQKKIEVGFRERMKMLDQKGNIGKALLPGIRSIRDSDPISALTGATFHLYQGLGNAGQLFLQAHQASLAAAAGGLRGIRALVDNPGFFAYTLTRDENLLNRLASSKLHGMEAADYKAMAKSYVKSGLDKPGTDQVGLEHFSGNIGANPISIAGHNLSNIGEGVVNLGLLPYNTGTRWGNQVAYKLAWQKVSELMPGIDKSSPEFLRMVLTHTADFNANMNAASKPLWSKGLLKVPTQYLRWCVNSIEQVLPRAIGGNPRLTATEKTRLAAGHLFLTGLNGSLGLGLAGGVGAAIDGVSQMVTGNPAPLELKQGLQKGFYDSVVDGLFNLDTEFGRRIGLGDMFQSIIDKFSGGQGQTSLSLIAGPSGQTLWKTATTVADNAQALMLYMKAEQTSQLPAETWNMVWDDMTTMVSSLSTAEQAYWIWNFKQIKDPKTGEPIVDNLNKWQAVAQILGFKDSRVTEYYQGQQFMQSRDKIVLGFAKRIADNRNNIAQAIYDKDWEKVDRLEAANAGFIQGIRQSDEMLAIDSLSKSDNINSQFESKWNQLKNIYKTKTGKELE